MGRHRYSTMVPSKRQATPKRQKVRERRAYVAYESYYKSLPPDQKLATAQHILGLPDDEQQAWKDKYTGYVGDDMNDPIHSVKTPPASIMSEYNTTVDPVTGKILPGSWAYIPGSKPDNPFDAQSAANPRENDDHGFEAEDSVSPRSYLRPRVRGGSSSEGTTHADNPSRESNAPQRYHDAPEHQQPIVDGDRMQHNLHHRAAKQHQSGSPNPVPCYRCAKRGKILGCYGAPRCERCKEKGYSADKCQGIVGRDEDSGDERPTAVSGKADKGGRRPNPRSPTKPYPLTKPGSSTKRKTVSKKIPRYLRGRMWEVEEIKSHRWKNDRLLYEIVWADEDANGNKWPNSEQADYQVTSALEDEYWAGRKANGEPEERDVSKGWPRLGWRHI